MTERQTVALRARRAGWTRGKPIRATGEPLIPSAILSRSRTAQRYFAAVPAACRASARFRNSAKSASLALGAASGWQ